MLKGVQLKIKSLLLFVFVVSFGISGAKADRLIIRWSAQRIVSGIDAQLSAKGLRKVGEGEGADLVFVYQTTTDTKTEINTFNTGGWGGWGRGRGGGMAQTTVSKIPVGQLIVDLGDVKNKKVVWRGKATDF